MSPCRDTEPCPQQQHFVPRRARSSPPAASPAAPRLKTSSSSTNRISVKIFHADSLSLSQQWHILLHQTKQHPLLFPRTARAARFNATWVKHKSFSRYQSKVSGDSGRETYAAASVLPIFWLLFLERTALNKSFVNSKNGKMWLRNGFIILKNYNAPGKEQETATCGCSVPVCQPAQWVCQQSTRNAVPGDGDEPLLWWCEASLCTPAPWLRLYSHLLTPLWHSPHR